eukprot:CAMPEP_0116562200 /NCGR_PEP_ID=MMETSP0397-20121206/12025_1 /TAXON_ID=216820 /ORGANISM="Cyclophora tenuis, Strain ECT3854" /LENGTH=275 /DNA_ID=CAMNT_0004088465 /DNA_START=155 /DNA_END=982 /DNA_ORIENTATION=+
MMLETSQELLVDSTPATMQTVPAEAKKRRRNKKKAVAVVSDSSSMSSTEKPKRKKAGKKSSQNKSKRHPKQAQEPEISEEEKTRFVALDCEMVGVGFDGLKSALARVCLVDWYGSVLLDVYVRPEEQITDYRTFVSGITPENLASEDAVSIVQCRKMVGQLLHGKILVGHGLKSDIRALGMTHPWYDTRDTGKYEPFMKVRFDDGVLWPRKLKDLAKEKLHLDIQQPGVSHSPQEDAHTAMELYKLVRRKWEKAMAYKYKKTCEIESMRMTQRSQ